jgi:capsular polysaccharide transport system permease protein
MINRFDTKKIAKTLHLDSNSWVGRRLLPLLPKSRMLKFAVIASLLAVFYWGIIASDRYVSESHVVIKRMDLSGGQSQNIDLASVISGSSGNKADQMMLRDHMLSVDMLARLNSKLNLRSHYSDWWIDPISRMWLEDSSMEIFHRHYLSRISVEFDDNSGVLIIKAQGYDPKTAHAIATMLVEEGERAMNEMARRMAQEQVTFLQKEVETIGERAIRARRAALEYQNLKRLISPQQTAEALAGVINGLEAKLTELKTRRSAMLGYLSPSAPGMVDINMQIAAVEKQITSERTRLASPDGGPLNRTVEEYQRLQMTAEMAQDMYKSALIALEKGRIEAMRSVTRMAVLQSPTMPEYSDEPQRFHNIVAFIACMFLLAGIAQLLGAIIKEHKD